MTTGDMIALLGVLLGCFAWVCNKLEKINSSLGQSVTHEQCSDKRENCPCVADIKLIKQKMKV